MYNTSSISQHQTQYVHERLYKTSTLFIHGPSMKQGSLGPYKQIQIRTDSDDAHVVI